MTGSIIVMMILGLIIIFASFFLTEKISRKETDFNIDLLTVDEDYEFSEREKQIIKRKIEDVIAKQAKDILYETNESLNSMANEKTMALGDYAVTVYDEIEKNHKEVMFLYSMLEDKQKDIMSTIKAADEAKTQVKEMLLDVDATRIKNEETVDVGREKRDEPTLEEKQQEYLREQAKEKHIQSFTEAEQQVTLESVESSNTEVFVDDSSVEAVLSQDEEIEEDVFDDTEIMDEDLFSDIDENDSNFDEQIEDEFEESENSNDIILEMHKNGESILNIAKQLGLGVGEVKLVIDLYRN